MIDLPINDILVIEFYNILIPPIFSGYMITFICIHSLASYDICPIEKTMLMIQKMSETAHLMGVIQTPTFCSIFYVRNAYQFLVSKGIVQESSKLKDNNIMKCFKVSNTQALEELVRSLRQDFLWEENYRIIRKVFEERFLAQNRSKDLQQRL